MQHNFVLEAGPGCYVARRYRADDDESSPDDESLWMIEWEDVCLEDFIIDASSSTTPTIPDIAIDPEENTLSLCNIESVYKVAYITVYDIPLVSKRGKILKKGTSINAQGIQKSCTTLIVLCPPLVFAHLCYIPEHVSPSTIQLESDVQEWRRHTHPNDTHTCTIGFPFQTTTTQTSFLCTQGEHGSLTHFFSGNYHAIDFRCDVGTPLVAVADGIVMQVKTDSSVTGIAVSNLFQWNSILLQVTTSKTESSSIIPQENWKQCFEMDDPRVDCCEFADGPLFVEYVHIQSAFVEPGTRVTAGQWIGESGSIGFSPEPHLHLAAYRSAEDGAPTCRVFFHVNNDLVPSATVQASEDAANKSTPKLFLPVAGRRYNAQGIVET